MAKKRSKGGSKALSSVQKFFPKVLNLLDAKKDVEIEVTDKDCNTSKRKDHSECAMAVAAKRAEHADGVIVARTTVYVVKGKVATRFKVPETVSREVVAFDRGADFAPGTYTLKAPSATEMLGQRANRATSPHTGRRGTGTRKKHHLTMGVRTVLGSKEL